MSQYWKAGLALAGGLVVFVVVLLVTGDTKAALAALTAAAGACLSVLAGPANRVTPAKFEAATAALLDAWEHDPENAVAQTKAVLNASGAPAPRRP